MLDNNPRPDTLDDVAMPERGEMKAGWRLWVLVIMLGVITICFTWNFATSFFGESKYPSFQFILFFQLTAGICSGLAVAFLSAKKQVGWVIALILASCFVVFFAFITAGFLLSTSRPVGISDDIGPSYLFALLILPFLVGSCFLLYLVTSQQVRRAFRIPRSWVARVLTFGGLVGAAMGAWFYMTLR